MNKEVYHVVSGYIKAVYPVVEGKCQKAYIPAVLKQSWSSDKITEVLDVRIFNDKDIIVKLE